MAGDARSDREALTAEAHTRHVVVWDVPATVERGGSYRLKVGVRCAARCMPADWLIEVRDPEGDVLATATPGAAPWPGTTALFHADLELTAPDNEGLFTYRAVAPATAGADAEAPGHDETRAFGISHEQASASFNVRVVPPAECRLTVIAVDTETQMPVEGASVVAHPYRAVTDERGLAELSMPRGEYRVFVSGRHYFPFRSDGQIASDTTIRAELDPDAGPTDAELWS